ncbi:hypothetical protein CULT_1810009 [[Clostridium] ultunense Esp]|nr:hypothetical protein CULT_1810009 [[Clostridium] ultunense Esp]
MSGLFIGKAIETARVPVPSPRVSVPSCCACCGCAPGSSPLSCLLGISEVSRLSFGDDGDGHSGCLDKENRRYHGGAVRGGVFQVDRVGSVQATGPRGSGVERAEPER